MDNAIKLEINDNIALITLSNPENFNPLNKITGKMLLEAIESIRNNRDIRCLIITGS
jgi:enoyl-CoA hydratase/carnithine racemase